MEAGGIQLTVIALLMCVFCYLLVLKSVYHVYRISMALESQHKGSNAPSIRCPVMDEESMRRGPWFESVLLVYFSALTWLVDGNDI